MQDKCYDGVSLWCSKCVVDRDWGRKGSRENGGDSVVKVTIRSDLRLLF